MSRVSIVLIEGRHITAADKRSIRDGIAHLRETFARFVEISPATVPNYAGIWLRRSGSRKRYSIDPCPNQLNRYRVTIRETDRNSYGVTFDRDSSVLIEAKGIEPLHHPAWADAAPIKQEELPL